MNKPDSHPSKNLTFLMDLQAEIQTSRQINVAARWSTISIPFVTAIRWSR
jgi:hypothetical protein